MNAYVQNLYDDMRNVNTRIANINEKLATVDKVISDQSAKIQTLEKAQTTTKTILAAQKIEQTNTEVALRAEIDKLKQQQTETEARHNTEKKESDTKIRQLETKLQDLALAYKELMEIVKKSKSDSNSFFGSSRAPSEVGDDNASVIDEELNAALSGAAVNDTQYNDD